jgi:hypothetical protein
MKCGTEERHPVSNSRWRNFNKNRQSGQRQFPASAKSTSFQRLRRSCRRIPYGFDGPWSQFRCRHLFATGRNDTIDVITKSKPKVSHQTATVTFRDAAAGLPPGTGLVRTLTLRPDGTRLARYKFADRRRIHQPTIPMRPVLEISKDARITLASDQWAS